MKTLLILWMGFLGGVVPASAVVQNTENVNQDSCWCPVCPEHRKPNCVSMDKFGISEVVKTQIKGKVISDKAI